MINNDERLQELSIQLRTISQQLHEIGRTTAAVQTSAMDTTANPQLAQKIVVAVGDELYGNAIAQFVLNHNWQGKPKFYLVHAVEPLPTLAPLAAMELQRILDDQYVLGTQMLLEIDRQIKMILPDAEIERFVETASAKELILQLAKTVSADFIIMGSHGRKGFQRFVLGSVSTAVASHAPCSVVIVRVSEQEELAFDKRQTKLSENDLPQSMESYAPPIFQAAPESKH